MTVSRKFKLFAFLTVASIVLSACGSASNTTAIATSVALTVQAQDTQRAAVAPTEVTPSETPTLLLSLPTAATTKLPPTAPTG